MVFLPALAGLSPLLILTVVAFLGLYGAGGSLDISGVLADPYIRGIVRFSILQAGLSALLSLVLAFPVARAIARQPRFFGRTLVIRCLGLPMVVPVIVAILGLVALYGRSGLVNEAAAVAGFDLQLNIYGLGGILLAHVFFNMPMAVRLFLFALQSVPHETWRLASQLNMDSGALFRFIEWPAVRRVIPGAGLLIFLLCFASFTPVLVLGGGPPNATIEVALFQALRFDFDLTRVLSLGLIQVCIGALVAGTVLILLPPLPAGDTTGIAAPRRDGESAGAKLLDTAVIGLAAIAVLSPFAVVLFDGLTGPLVRVLADDRTLQAAYLSLRIGLSAGILAVLLGWLMILTIRRWAVNPTMRPLAEALETTGSVILVVPPFVLGAGLFVSLSAYFDIFFIGPVLVVLINAMMGIPFVLRIVGPSARLAQERQGRLTDSLRITGWNRFLMIDWPILRARFGLALALCSALAAGDMGVIALFASPATETLPLLLYRLIGAYRLDEAAVVALVLVSLCFALFMLIERICAGHEKRLA